MRVSKLAVGVAATAGVLGLGMAAFAVEGGGETSSATDPTVTTAVTTTTLGSGEGQPATTDPVEGTEGTTTTTEASHPVSTVDCPEGETYANHGTYVSSVAHDPDRAHGDVAAAAQSECGRTLASTEPEDTTEPVDTTEPEDTTDATPAGGDGQSGSPGNSGNAPGRNK